jgi:hypothetical protein
MQSTLRVQDVDIAALSGWSCLTTSVPSPRMATCPGALIVHADDTVMSCTDDDERDGCRGRDVRHEGDLVRCWDWMLTGCN